MSITKKLTYTLVIFLVSAMIAGALKDSGGSGSSFIVGAAAVLILFIWGKSNKEHEKAEEKKE